MGLFDFMKRDNTEQQPAQPIYSPLNNVNDVLLTALLNGETIDREKAMTLPAVSGAVDLISGTIASMPVKLFKYKQGKVEEIENDTRVRILNGDTGDTLDAYQLKKALTTDFLLGKGGYAYIERNRNEVTGLYYVEDIYITILRNYKPIYKDYVILVEGQQYKRYDFVKLLRNTKDGASGIGVTNEVSKALETAYNTLLYQLGMVKSGGNKKGFIKATKKLGQEEINTLKQAWKNLYANNEENVVVLNNGLEFQEASNNSVEMQLNESKKTLQDEINNIFHIYPNDFWRTFKEAIYPIIKAFETALNRDLLLEKEKKNYFFEFDVKEIVKANLTERYNAYKLAKETGFMTLNEIRRAENMNYVEGLDVVNVGLGAVLYDTNTHKYYTPNTDALTDPSDGVQTGVESETDKSIQNLIMDKELDTAFEQSGNSAERTEERFNPYHDGKTGKFTTGGGAGSAGGGSGGSGANDEKIKQLEDELAHTSLFGAGAARRKEINEELAKLKGVSEKPAPKKTQRPTPKATPKVETKKELPVTPQKEKQFEVIQKTNAMTDDYHTGIRKPSDIKSAQEAFKTTINNNDDFLYPDFTKADGEKALKTGKVTVYSSKPIENGGFVSPSRQMAKDYAGSGKVYSKEIDINDVAWIDSNEGQFAKT